MTITIVDVALATSLLLLLYGLLRKSFGPSPLDAIPGPPSKSWLMGNLPEMFDFDSWKFHEELAAKYGRVAKVNSFLGTKNLYISDPLALYHIIVKDQHIFEKHDDDFEIFSLIFGPGLLSVKGDRHRKQRKILNPVFSTSHLRNMVPTFYGIAKQLRGVIASKIKDGPLEVEMMLWLTHTALELVGQAGLGRSFDLLHEGAVSPYAEAIKCLGPVFFEYPILLFVGPSLMKIGTPKFRRFIVERTPHWLVQRIRHMIDTMQQTSEDVFYSSSSALRKGNAAFQEEAEGKDILSILLRANNKASSKERLADEEVIAQLTTLMFAAMDTTSTAVSRILHLLAQYPELQEKLRKELSEAQADSDLTYDELDRLPYLDAICRETSRYYCTVPTVGRAAAEDAVLPLSSPITDVNGKEMREIFVPKGTRITVAIMAANRSKEIWGEDAEEWKPQRWLAPLPESVSQAHLPGVYSNMMTFLGGSRACIGFKFAELEIKVILAVLLRAFRFSLSEKEIFWRMGMIVTPSVKGSTRFEPELYLKVEAVDD
ncbi:cytochrome P450 [Gloeophyllum trabeum ATCC 11539]|uniref:Cytochrome P450 n=1 Tax=Gloeophyllum trabeum (strain ATCC 11539 / FP-39264 / Madison 617) TaxID=670483 RepID=S7Q917_GLOTA|nr:cytochrome P450 [Gloeophyllum trabeum ATCC 11539]EPQ55977.1 cytochrome P450 [Gloeophyllum trabeum ATCC 11539]